MFQDGGAFKPQTKTVNFMFLNGGVGDHMASLVAMDYVYKRYPWITPLVWMPDFLVRFAKHVLNRDENIFGFSDMRGRYQPKRPTKTTAWDGHISPMKIHSLDYAFLRLCDENPGIEHKNYLQIRSDEIHIDSFNLPPRYVVITSGYTAAVREFKAEHVNAILDYCKGKGLSVVFLGQSATPTGSAHIIRGEFNDEIRFNEGTNLIDKTSLLQAAKIMGQSKAVLGVDNGLLHVAGCTDAPIIGGFTTVTPEIRMPVRRNTLGWRYFPVVPDKALNCRFCQQNTNFLYGHDYKKCLYSDIICTKQMTAVKFIEALEGIL